MMVRTAFSVLARYNLETLLSFELRARKADESQHMASTSCRQASPGVHGLLFKGTTILIPSIVVAPHLYLQMLRLPFNLSPQ